MPCVAAKPWYWECCTDASSYGAGSTSVDVRIRNGNYCIDYELYLERQYSSSSWVSMASKKGSACNDTGVLKFSIVNYPGGTYRIRWRVRMSPSAGGGGSFTDYYTPTFPVAGGPIQG